MAVTNDAPMLEPLDDGVDHVRGDAPRAPDGM